MELAHKAALRVAQFIGTSSDDRHRLFRVIKKSYRARSKVAHGDDPPRTLDDTLRETEMSLRRALRRWIDPTVSHDMTEVDAQLLE
jgi:hypothetical protein